MNNIIETIKKHTYTKKISDLNITTNTDEDKRIIDAMFKIGKNAKGRKHQLDCFENTMLTIKYRKSGNCMVVRIVGVYFKKIHW